LNAHVPIRQGSSGTCPVRYVVSSVLKGGQIDMSTSNCVAATASTYARSICEPAAEILDSVCTDEPWQSETRPAKVMVKRGFFFENVTLLHWSGRLGQSAREGAAVLEYAMR
jgi:hypothetical protein